MNTAKKYLLCVFFIAGLVAPLFSQNLEGYITRIDTSKNETIYGKIQLEIVHKEIGRFGDTTYDADGKIYQVIRYQNFIPKESPNDIWTYVNKYVYDKRGRVEKAEHWKTDNRGSICKCGTWQRDRSGIWVVMRAYPKCNIIRFDCDQYGEPLKKK